MKPDVAEADRKWLGPARGRALLILGDVSLDSLSPYLRIRVYCTVFVQVLPCDAPFVHGVPRKVLPRCSPHSLEPSQYTMERGPNMPISRGWIQCVECGSIIPIIMRIRSARSEEH